MYMELDLLHCEKWMLQMEPGWRGGLKKQEGFMTSAKKKRL